jgi:hypothetical protein
MDLEPDYATMSEEEIAERLKPHKFASFDEALAWFRSQNPNMEKNHPEELDWQAIKSEARRY